MSIDLTDDGTMDTVLRCSECGEEFRFNYDAGCGLGETDEDGKELISDEEAYDEWVDGCIEEIEQEHECPKYHVQTWFERDRAHVALYFGTSGDANDDLIVEWWDEDVNQAIEDGFLKPKDLLGSALAYAKDHDLLPKK